MHQPMQLFNPTNPDRSDNFHPRILASIFRAKQIHWRTIFPTLLRVLRVVQPGAVLVGTQFTVFVSIRKVAWNVMIPVFQGGHQRFHCLLEFARGEAVEPVESVFFGNG